jgi:hypothetical protein
VADQEDEPALVPPTEVGQERAGLLDHVPVALPAGERLLDSAQPLSAHLLDGPSVQLAVVALAEPGVESDLDPSVAEGQLGRLDRAAEVGDVGEVDLAPPLAQPPRLLAARRRELSIEPAGRDPALVVDRQRVRLVDELDGRR